MAFESSQDAFLDSVSRPGKQQAEPDHVGDNPWREEERTPRKHGHTIHDGLPWYTPIREIMPQPPHGPESLHARQPRTRDTRKDDRADRGPKTYQLAHLNQKGQFQQGNDDEEEGEPPKNAHDAIIPRAGGIGPAGRHLLGVLDGHS